MQVIKQLKIEEPERKESFLEILSDKYCRSILETIMDTPKSAIEVSREKMIPLSTVYRRIQQLHDSKMKCQTTESTVIASIALGSDFSEHEY